MKFKWNDIENAFLFVSMAPMYQNHAFLNIDNGQIYYSSETSDSDKIPKNMNAPGKYIEIPHKNDLDLGKDLVYQYIKKYLPEHYDTVWKIFGKKGAYSRYKQFLENLGKLEEWFKFENGVIDKTLRDWCKENEIEIDKS